MRDRTRFALKQATSIFLLVGTLALRVIPGDLLEKPRGVFLQGVGSAASPLYVSAGAVLKVPGMGATHSSRADLEREVSLLTAQLSAKESELRKVRSALESLGGFRSTPIANLFFAYSGDLMGYIRGGDTNVFGRMYMVNLGSRQGVRKGSPAVWGQFAIGQVSQVSRDYSWVRILGDPKSRVAVRFERSRHQGILAGNGRQVCPVRYVPNRVKEGEIKVGDAVLTSGADGIFPADLLVGKVVRFYRRPSEPSADVKVELSVDFSRIESCLILKRKAGIPEE